MCSVIAAPLRRRQSRAWWVLLLLLPVGVRAQALRPIRLAPANATLDADFVVLTSLREVADGRVIVTDGRAQQLYLADFTAGTAAPLSRKGKGPLEWSFVGFVQRTRGDSSIMTDWGNQRWLLFDGARVVGTTPPDHPAVKATKYFNGADQNGHVLTQRSRPLTTSGSIEYTRRDSQVVLLIDRSTGRVDTVAQARERPHRYTQTLNDKGGISSNSSAPTEPSAQGEEAYLMNDGTIALVRLEPLRVDFRAPDGRWTLGPPLPIRGEPLDARERARVAQSREESRKQMREMGLPEPPRIPLPTTLPALERLDPRELEDGRIALRRKSTLNKPAVRYIIVNRRGTIDGEITLAANEEIIGFGPTSVYVAFKDEDDIQRLRRHPWR